MLNKCSIDDMLRFLVDIIPSEPISTNQIAQKDLRKTLGGSSRLISILVSATSFYRSQLWISSHVMCCLSCWHIHCVMLVCYKKQSGGRKDRHFFDVTFRLVVVSALPPRHVQRVTISISGTCVRVHMSICIEIQNVMQSEVSLPVSNHLTDTYFLVPREVTSKPKTL